MGPVVRNFHLWITIARTVLLINLVSLVYLFRAPAASGRAAGYLRSDHAKQCHDGDDGLKTDRCLEPCERGTFEEPQALRDRLIRRRFDKQRSVLYSDHRCLGFCGNIGQGAVTSRCRVTRES